MTALPFLLGTICVLILAYRYYSAFLASRVLLLRSTTDTPAHRLKDGQNYVPTHRWVLFGHHFAAITGAGPLIGPVLAAQFGFLPGFLWLLIGVVIGGAVHDFVILTGSLRFDGKSIAEIAESILGPWAGRITAMAILTIILIALSGLGVAVVNALAESPWGTFTIATTIPVAFFMGLYMYRWRVGRVFEATVLGIGCLIGAVIVGRFIPGSPWASYFTFSKETLIIMVASYGFIASVLPVWMLLCPRDYLSSFMKLGTIAFLILSLMIVNPVIHMPAVTAFADGGGPIVPGKLFPFVFITIACGAISGFHGLVASGTTPKMLSNEQDARFIGYGAMLCEGLVGITSLIAACALYPEDYFAINTTPEKFSTLGLSVIDLPNLAAQVGEEVAGRTGGAVSLAIGIAKVFSGLPGFKDLMSYWYHFAIMFEALFILTTIDTGTRVARFLLQEFIGRASPRWRQTDWLPGTLISTLLIVLGWGSLLWSGSISTIWPMFGIANQLLAAVSLVLGTVLIAHWGQTKYIAVTVIPLAFVSTTTLIAGFESIFDQFLPLAQKGSPVMGYLNIAMILLMMGCLACILCLGAKYFVEKTKERKNQFIPLKKTA